MNAHVPQSFARNSAGLLDKPRHLMLELPREHFHKRLADLRQARMPYLSEWQDIADHIRPRRSRSMREGQTSTPRDVTTRDREARKIINGSPMFASRTLRSGMQSGASSPARPWFKLTTPDPAMGENAEVKAWLTTVARRLGTIFARSNVYNNLHTGYGDLGDFGQYCMVIDEDFDNVINTHLFAHGEFCFATDEKGVVNTIYREFSMTVLQVVRKWGRNSVSKTVANLYDTGKWDARVQIVDAIEPNVQQVRGAPGAKGSPFLRVYFEQGNDADKLLSVHPLHEFPACCPRWEVGAGEAYGFGPGLEALPDARALQYLERRKAVMIDKFATPPTQSFGSSSSQMRVNHRAGDHTFVPDAGAQGSMAGVRVLYEMSAQGQAGIEREIERTENRIARAYYQDIFMMLAESDRRQITAREIDERREEKLLQLGPVVERVHGEALEPLVTRTFNIMMRARGPQGQMMVPEPPKILQGMDLKVTFISMLAQAQRAVAVGGIERLASIVGSLSGAYPSVLDKFDADQAVDEYADAIGTPTGIVVADDQVEKIRADKAKQAQGQAAAQMAMQGADTAKVLADTTVSDQNLLGRMLGGVGAA